MGRKKKIYTCHFEPEQVEKLRELSKRTRIPVAVLIRQAVHDFIAKVGGDFLKEKEHEEGDAGTENGKPTAGGSMG